MAIVHVIVADVQESPKYSDLTGQKSDNTSSSLSRLTVSGVKRSVSRTLVVYSIFEMPLPYIIEVIEIGHWHRGLWVE
jgi:hypothetical protein